MTDDERRWLTTTADALDRARRHRDIDDEGERVTTIKLSDELARSVADRLRALAGAP